MSRPELDRYRGPNVAVDVAALTVATPPGSPRGRGALCVLLLDTDGGPALPGTFLRPQETVRAALGRLFADKVGVDASGMPLRALRVFDDPGRDPRSSWSLSLPHVAAFPASAAAEARGRWEPVDRLLGRRGGPGLLYDHDAIVVDAVGSVRSRYETHPDPDGWLGDEVTLGELKALHEAVLGDELRFDTFKRRMTSAGLEPVGTRAEGPGRPSVTYENRPLPEVPERLRLPRVDEP